jgi:drug/metabolite transporter (DMT)-like permease
MPARGGTGRIYALIVLMVMLWSSNFVAAKLVLREMHPLLVSALRTTIAAFLILPLYFWSEREQGWSWRDARLLFGIGIFGIALNQAFFVYGISQTSVSHSAVIIALTPMLVLLVAAFKGQERITPQKMLGMAIALTGVVTLQMRSTPGAGKIVGDVLVFLAAITFAVFTVAGKAAAARHGTITLNTFAYVGGALAFAPITVWHGARYSLAAVSWTGWLTLFYMALFPSVVCYLIYSYALSHIPASRVSAFAYLQPLFATTMALPILHESLSGGVVLGGALVLAGVWVTERA